MSILDTFFILFKSDTTDLEKGQKKAEKSTQDLQDRVKRTNDSVMDLGLSFVTMAEQAAAAVGIAVGVGAAIKGAFSVEEQTLDLYRFAKSLGISYQEAQKWVFAGKMVGASASEITGDIKKLVLAMNQVGSAGGVTIQTPLTQLMQRLIQTGYIATDSHGKIKDFGQALKSVADTINKMKSPGAGVNYGQALGLSEGTIRLLQQGTAHIDEFLAEAQKAGLATDEQGAGLAKTSRDWTDFTAKVQNATRILAGPFVDAVDALLDPSDKVIRAFQSLAIATGLVGAAVLGLKFDAAIEGLGFLAAATWAAAGPWALLILGIAALAAAIYFFPDLEEKFSWLKTAHEWALDLGATFDWLAGRIGKLIALMDVTTNPKLSLKERWKEAKDIWNDPGDNSQPPDNKSVSFDNQTIIAAKAAIHAAMTTPIAAQTNNSILNNSRSTAGRNINVSKIEVHTQAADAGGIAKSITGELQKLWSGTTMMFSDGVAG